MKRKLLFTVATILCVTVPALMAWADFAGDLRRFLGIERAINPSSQPVPNFLNGIKVAGTDYTATELNLVLGAGDSGALVTGITAGTTQTQAGATLLTGRYNNVTTVGTAGDGVRLPTAAAGLSVTIRNSAASNTLKAYPFSGDSINALAVNLSVDIPALSETTFTAINTTVWYSEPTALYLSAPTTLTGGLQLKAAASAGNTTTLITNASQAAARTYTIPDAGASANFVLSEGAATVNGVKTFGSAPVFPAAGITIGTKTFRPGGGMGAMVAQVAFGGTGDNVEQAIHTASIPANTLAAGDVLRLYGRGVISTSNGTDTLTSRWAFNLAGTPVAIGASNAVDATNADIVLLDLYVTIRTIGASGTAYVTGSCIIGADEAVISAAISTIPTNAPLTIDLGAVWSSENAGNNINFNQAFAVLN